MAGDADRADEAMTFSHHVLSLNAAALLNLGAMPDDDGQVHKDLEAARLLIDTLQVLRHKTQGNLDEDETRLLDTVLYDLRVRFVQAR